MRLLRTEVRVASRGYTCDCSNCPDTHIWGGSFYTYEVWAVGNGKLEIRRYHEAPCCFHYEFIKEAEREAALMVEQMEADESRMKALNDFDKEVEEAIHKELPTDYKDQRPQTHQHGHSDDDIPF